jgi:hypothetical protein
LDVFGYANNRQDKIDAWRVAEPEGPAPLTADPVTMLDADPVLSSHVVILKTPFLKVHVDFILFSSKYLHRAESLKSNGLYNQETSSVVMEPESSLPCSQDPSPCPYPERDEFSPFCSAPF